MRSILIFSVLLGFSSCYINEYFDVNDINKVVGVYSNTEIKETMILYENGTSYFIKKKKVRSVCNWVIARFDIFDAIGLGSPPYVRIICFNPDSIDISKVEKIDFHKLSDIERAKYASEFYPIENRFYIYYNNKSLVGRGSVRDPDENWILKDIVLERVADISKADSILKSLNDTHK